AEKMTDKLKIDHAFLMTTLKELLHIPSPSGMTDEIVGYLCQHLAGLDIPFELTRRGAVRADLKGAKSSPDRAIVSHLDTLGAMVIGFYDNGGLQLVPIGTWPARFGAGARVTVYAAERRFPGTIVPRQASGHPCSQGVDTQPIAWPNLELRLDEKV